VHDGYPSDDELRAADLIVLKDPALPNWELPILRGPASQKKPFTAIILNVQSHVPGVVEAWRARVLRCIPR
jgi:hypothetical protein